MPRKIKVDRRGFMGLMGGAAVAGKGALKSAATKVAGIGVPGLYPPTKSPDLRGESYEVAEEHRLEYVKKLAGVLPRWKEREFERWSKNVYTIDPDIYALKSMSLTRMVQAQRKRNFENMKKDFFNEPIFADERKKFLSKISLGWL